MTPILPLRRVTSAVPPRSAAPAWPAASLSWPPPATTAHTTPAIPAPLRRNTRPRRPTWSPLAGRALRSAEALTRARRPGGTAPAAGRSMAAAAASVTTRPSLPTKIARSSNPTKSTPTRSARPCAFTRTSPPTRTIPWSSTIPMTTAIRSPGPISREPALPARSGRAWSRWPTKAARSPGWDRSTATARRCRNSTRCRPPTSTTSPTTTQPTQTPQWPCPCSLATPFQARASVPAPCIARARATTWPPDWAAPSPTFSFPHSRVRRKRPPISWSPPARRASRPAPTSSSSWRPRTPPTTS